MKKSRLLFLFALLLVAVSGAWAQDTYTVTFKANGKTKTVENVTLPRTFSCVSPAGTGELDLIIQELYGLSEGFCEYFEQITNYASVTCGGDGENPYITISAPFDGTARVAGSYYDPEIGVTFNCFLDITCSQSVSTGVEINETNFPDAKFRDFLKSQTYGTDGVITDAEIAAVTSIDVSFSDIVNMNGIEYFTALQSLNCANSKISQLDLTKNTALQQLNCNSNQLTTLDLSQNTALVGLFCADNQLTALDLSQNTALEQLFCGENQLSSLNLAQNTALTKVVCYGNQLTTLDLTKNTALEEMDCHGNQLSSLDLTKCLLLTGLACDHNKLTNLDVTYNTALQTLSCNNNQLSSLDLKQNTALNHLICNNNQLTALDLTKNTALEEMNCSVNQIKGTAMDALIASLPNNTEEETNYLYVINSTDNGELNAMTAAQATAVKAKGWTAYAYDGEDWKEYTGPAAYTTSVNIEQLVLDEGLTYNIQSKFDESNIAYANLNALDGLNDLEDKPLRNVAFLGLKLKTQGAYIKVMVKKGSTLNVKLGCVNNPVNVTINGTAQEPIAANPSGDNYKTNYTYSYSANDADAEITFTTTTAKTVVFKQIMVDENIADVTLPAPTAYLITVADGIKNGTVTVNWADKKYRTPVDAEVTVTATPATGYELDAISVKGAKNNEVYEVTDGKFIMPDEEVTVSATFKQITGINNVNANGNANQNAKVIKGGKLIIFNNGKMYSDAGAQVK